jgi:membrane-bound metal-dependent hydrolase YbcI (DUF457 family)
MASVIGHSFGGVISKQLFKSELEAKKERLLLGLLIFLALMPDLDVLVYIMVQPSGMTPHRGVSHGLPFIFVVALLATGLTARYFGLGKKALFVVCFGALLSHLMLDFLMGAGPPLPLLAPFSDVAFLSPVSLIPWAFYSTSATGLLDIILWRPAILGYGLELLIFVPITLLLKKPRSLVYQFVMLLISSVAVTFTVLMYNN